MHRCGGRAGSLRCRRRHGVGTRSGTRPRREDALGVTARWRRELQRVFPCSLSTAVSKAQAGKTVVALPGVYHGGVVLDKQIRLRGIGAVIDAIVIVHRQRRPDRRTGRIGIERRGLQDRKREVRGDPCRYRAGGHRRPTTARRQPPASRSATCASITTRSSRTTPASGPRQGSASRLRRRRATAARRFISSP